jgi:16S rRNA (guanine(966)-N(2))-methyltransferase RsmD
MLNKGKLWENFEMSRHFKLSPQQRPRRDNRVRIIGGEWRSRMLVFPDAAGLRPTGDRVRETLFNWLGQTLHGTSCLDLFAGSGALGFEAASRGAERVVMIESNAATVRVLNENKRLLGADRCEILCGDALAFLRRHATQFDIVFVDPPFASTLLGEVLECVAPSLKVDGVVYIEWGGAVDQLLAAHRGTGWRVIKQGKAGVVHFALITAQPSAA